MLITPSYATVKFTLSFKGRIDCLYENFLRGFRLSNIFDSFRNDKISSFEDEKLLLQQQNLFESEFGAVIC